MCNVIEGGGFIAITPSFQICKYDNLRLTETADFVSGDENMLCAGNKHQRFL